MGDKGINHDVALKCGQDVAGAIERNMKLVEDRQGAMLVTVAAAGMSMAWAAGAFSAVHDGTQPGAEWLDALWETMIRPMALSSLGDRTDFLAILERLK